MLVGWPATEQARGQRDCCAVSYQGPGEIYTDQSGMMPFDSPRELRTDEIGEVVEEFRQATQNAYSAGFDGVELHCASGYLPAQFLSTGTNQRGDAYGGMC